MSQIKKQVTFLFGEAGQASAAVLGGKGAGLAELTRLGVSVPPGFTVTTSVARAFAQHGKLPKRLTGQLERNMHALEVASGARFGDNNNPLLVSVRSGAPASMPGMMDTVLNLGLNPQTVAGLARRSNECFAYDCYRRFLALFGSVVMGVPRQAFETVWSEVKGQYWLNETRVFEGLALQEVCHQYRALILDSTGQNVPDDVNLQLNMAVLAVLKSADSERAQAYRQVHGIANLGTAVNVQSMVFGNFDHNSCTGVVFSSNVATGEAGLWGEYLVNAQGEDVVAGTSTPLPISMMKGWNAAVYNELDATVKALAQSRRQVVDVEFTVQSGKLFILQVRGAKLAPEAAVTIAIHKVWSKQQTKEEARASISDEQVQVLLARTFNQQALAAAQASALVGVGLPASPGVATGVVVTSSAAAVAAAGKGQSVILVRPDTSPDDLPGMLAAAAIVTGNGGSTCHAAVVARGLGKPAVVALKNVQLREGEIISVDAGTGVVVRGAVEMAEACNKKEVNIFLRWLAEEQAKLWPAPRLDFDRVDQVADCSQMIASFYLSEDMCRAAKGTPLAVQAAKLRVAVHTSVAERLAMYLVLACGGEVRHAGTYWTKCAAAVGTLRSQFGVLLDADDRFAAQKSSVNKLKNLPLEKQVRFLELVIEVFEQGDWSRSFGGRAWAAIAQAALGFLTGKLSHSVFADHAFDLQHNNGTVFGKNVMIDVRSSSDLHRLLDLKKHATGVADFYKPATQWHGVKCEAAVEAVYRRGVQLKLW